MATKTTKANGEKFAIFAFMAVVAALAVAEIGFRCRHSCHKKYKVRKRDKGRFVAAAAAAHELIFMSSG